MVNGIVYPIKISPKLALAISALHEHIGLSFHQKCSVTPKMQHIRWESLQRSPDSLAGLPKNPTPLSASASIFGHLDLSCNVLPNSLNFPQCFGGLGKTLFAVFTWTRLLMLWLRGAMTLS